MDIGGPITKLVRGPLCDAKPRTRVRVAHEPNRLGPPQAKISSKWCILSDFGAQKIDKAVEAVWWAHK